VADRFSHIEGVPYALRFSKGAFFGLCPADSPCLESKNGQRAIFSLTLEMKHPTNRMPDWDRAVPEVRPLESGVASPAGLIHPSHAYFAFTTFARRLQEQQCDLS
jgi:hypothetical protein